jgi:hypothetical protein
MSRLSPLSSPLLLGFDEIERVLDRVTKSTTDGYPPYNIERLAKEHWLLPVSSASKSTSCWKKTS